MLVVSLNKVVIICFHFSGPGLAGPHQNIRNGSFHNFYGLQYGSIADFHQIQYKCFICKYFGRGHYSAKSDYRTPPPRLHGEGEIFRQKAVK